MNRSTLAHLTPKKAGPIMGLLCSALIMLTTLYKYFVLFSLPWYSVQAGYIGIIGLSLLWLLISGETSRIQVSFRITMLYLIPYLFMLAYSMLVWILLEGNLGNVRRGLVPIGYQMLQILAIGAMCAMLGSQGIRYTVIGLLLGNLCIAISVLLKRGLATGVSEMLSFFLHLGSVDNPTSRGFEIHDLTFAFGELVIFYLAFGAKEKHRVFFLTASTAFFILGWKRIAMPAVVLVPLYIWWLRRRREAFQQQFTALLGIGMTVAAFVFIFIIRSGLLEYITQTYGVNMMGRTQLYAFIEPHYKISVTYIGHGIGYITEVMRNAIASSTAVLNHEESIHSDILARYVELGFPGNLVWSLLYYWYTFRSLAKTQSVEVGLVFFAGLLFCYLTYFSDNTVSYYHINWVLRLLPICKALESQENIPLVLEERRKERLKLWQSYAKERRN